MTSDQPVLVLLDEPRPAVEVATLGAEPSALTGKTMRRIVATMQTHDEQLNEQLNLEFGSHQGMPAIISDTSGVRWQVTQHSSSYSRGNGPTVFSHTVHFQEHEELDLQRLEFGEVTVVPARWSYESRDDASILTVIGELDAELHDRLEQWLADHRAPVNGYFPVHWVGVSDQPIPMRFGKCVWQPLVGGRVRHLLNLVREEKPVDDVHLFSLLNQPELDRLQESSIRSMAKIDALVEELHRAGVLDSAALGRIKERAADAPGPASREFERADDVEAFFFRPSQSLASGAEGSQ